MGDVRGFLEHARRERPHVDPAKRLEVWTEIERPMPEDALRAQASRCMDCGVPFCQSDTGCPVDNLIPVWNDLAYRGRWREALERLHATNNFPEWTGRVCPAPCEGACVLGIHDAPVAIKAIEVEIVERGFAEGWIVPRPPAVETGRRVAIVGSGPAGLAAAQQLRRAGHGVTVFERDDRVGGLLTYGIPNMKLDKAAVERRVQQLAAEGVRFVTGAHVGVDVSVEELRTSHDALLLAVGATTPRDLAIPGRRGLRGIHFAMELLTEATRRALGDEPDHARPDAAGKRVIVIGGGDTGTDCVATALRQGCASLTNLELMARPPEVRGPGNPWPEWPAIFRVDYGHEEAAARFGADPRRYAALTKRFLGDDAGRVSGVETVDVAWEGGALREVPGSARVHEADLVLLALGFTGPEEVGGLALTRGPRGAFAAGRGHEAGHPTGYETEYEGVFVAGDCRRGQSLIVWAIAEGRAAARAIDERLMGESALSAPSAL